MISRKNWLFKSALLAVIAMVGPVTSADAAVVIATDTVTGGPGAYTHTFSLTNNIGGDNNLYFFGVDLSGTITGTPASWAGTTNGNAPWTNTTFGGSSRSYSNTWCCAASAPGGTPSGTTTTGFSVLSTDNPATIHFFTYAVDGDDTAADGHFNRSGNPGFEDVVTSAEAVPEPAMWLMMIVGFGAVGGAMRNRTRRMGFASA